MIEGDGIELKKQFLYLFLVLLLCGCGKENDDINLRNTSETDTVVGELKEEESFQLPEYFAPVAGQEDLYKLDVEDINNLGSISELMLYKDYLAVSHVEMPDQIVENEDRENVPEIPEASMTLLLFDLESGKTKATASFSDGYESMQVAGEHLVIRSYEDGKLCVLDDSLIPQKEFTTSPSCNLNHIDANCEYVYTAPNNEIVKQNCTTQESEPLFGDCEYFSIDRYHRDGISINYTDIMNQNTHNVYLDFNTGEVENLPFHGSYSFAECVEGLWLATDYNNKQSCFLGKDENPFVFSKENANYSLVGGPAPLCSNVYMDDGKQITTFYREDGSFYGSIYATLEQGNMFNPIWCSKLNGYFLYQIVPETGNCVVLFWDARNAKDGSDLQVQKLSDICPVAIEHWGKLDFEEWTKELEEKYKLKVVVGEECPTDYGDFVADVLTEPLPIRHALTEFEIALHAYPENFIEQLVYGAYTDIQVYIMQGIHASSPEITTIDSYAGVVSYYNAPHHMMVLDGVGQTLRQTVFHEFSHIIDEKLLHESFNSGGIYSEEQWEKLNPPEFSYAWHRNDRGDSMYNEDYFIDDYSCSFPTEDRARILEYAMIQTGDYFSHEGLREKLAYYSACIRYYFDTTGWGEETTWEQPLKGYRYVY